MKDKYIETIEQAGFQIVKIIEENQPSFEDIVNDPRAKVVVANCNKGTQELKSISELGEQERERLKDAMVATTSINVSAVKPSE